jgi:adenylate cyclase class 2
MSTRLRKRRLRALSFSFYTASMAGPPQEIEIKFKVDDLRTLTRMLPDAGFRSVTERTHELNTLYDLPGFPLRRRGAILRLRQYGPKWTFTYKDRKGDRKASAKHKVRREIETALTNGPALAQILEATGFKAVFAYEKFRSEWADGTGHVVIDETPLGTFGEIEGPASWIDRTAGQLGIDQSQYITASYSELFLAWKRKARSRARHMLFSECC